MLFKVLQNLIKNKRYSKEDIQNRVDVFMAYNRITEEQYAELMDLINEVYKENIEENTETTNTEEKNTETNTETNTKENTETDAEVKKENTEQTESTDKE